MKVDAVVVTYNRKELLIECINAILNQTYKLNKVIIIDNNSMDGTYNLLEKEKIIDNKLVKYIKLEKNIGGAGGFYEGMKYDNENTDSDFVWIMDDDTIPTETALEELITAQEKLENCGKHISYLASAVYGENSEPMNVPNINLNVSNNGYKNWYMFLKDGLVRIDDATFVSLLISKKAIKNVGYPMKNYFIWGDDTEYTLRLNKYFGEAYMVGKSIVIHKRKNAKILSIEEEDNKNRINMYFYMIRNNLINKKNYYGFNKMIKFFIKNQLISLKILFIPKCKCKMKKFTIIHKALTNYLFKRYDYNAFNHRLDVNVKYK